MRLRKQGPQRDEGGAPAAQPAPTGLELPSIWLGSFASGQEWAQAVPQRAALAPVIDAIDDRLMVSRHPVAVQAWCAACEQVQPMTLAWHFGEIEPDGSVHPAWTETGGCPGCGLNSRMRALIDFLRSHPRPSDGGRCFAAERVTSSYPMLQQLFPDLLGSEYLGAERQRGALYPHQSGIEVRHEDLTALTFHPGVFGTIITQDVFEHVPDYSAAFAECHRVLQSGGRLVFTVPFFPDAVATEVRATVGADGAVTHLLPPEIHGNPVGDGSLCFQHFGWDLLDSLRAAGFAHAAAHAYWGPWQGHFGFPFFVFEARRAG
ncbi:MAG: class I SAM-dependent methyltransferase [Actinomycetota bacterium]|nr:class I SAM-dependent methyltransferase [Actinomycetota bacterium]